MFKHKGKTRTLSHNLKIASLLSFVAGIVNVAGFLSVQRLTTNVTGHFAFLIDEVFKWDIWKACIFFLYIFFFFLGSFCSNLIVEIISRKSEEYIYVIPTIIEITILSTLPFFGDYLITQTPDLLACSLLFAMGLQNSLVTSISNAMVRTTHLTGLFTDLGIELSQLIFYRTKEAKSKLLSSIRLRLTIIAFFFIGGLLGGIFYAKLHLWVLLIAAIALLFGLVYDNIKFRIIKLKRKQRIA
ncbi:MAG TPA: YoaK family protein [Phnomibacter sp.]|nr:YoaK family protein [Phnomibacter sp.]